ncbi:META domain-containing protein [Sedimentitalea nanhaiensis]|uniref:Heat shock protein HslJ n=1 Tax=Sedimentitalea nanhaiensis TaxID=999627 RepID=A0A1I7BMJ5_9RHOB|nr:META domain-containing protein [Sedimentitalea nanhaiensis]SFT88311.1 Heat shock protein HslJ [Sedimentitalea nanhaiensis]
MFADRETSVASRAGILAVVLTLASCASRETVAAYGAAGRIWRLTELDGAAFGAVATLTFPSPGKIAAKTPCASYAAPMSAPYPWFEMGAVSASRTACPDPATDAEFLRALHSMTQSEVTGDVLILSNETGREMVFKSVG